MAVADHSAMFDSLLAGVLLCQLTRWIPKAKYDNRVVQVLVTIGSLAALCTTVYTWANYLTTFVYDFGSLERFASWNSESRLPAYLTSTLTGGCYRERTGNCAHISARDLSPFGRIDSCTCPVVLYRTSSPNQRQQPADLTHLRLAHVSIHLRPIVTSFRLF